MPDRMHSFLEPRLDSFVVIRRFSVSVKTLMLFFAFQSFLEHSTMLTRRM
jgi:hypothetical protein